MAEVITSADNQKYKTWKSLLESKGVKKNGLCLVSGEKVVHEALSRQAEGIQAFVYVQEQPHSLLNSLPQDKTFLLPKALFEVLDALGTHAPLAIVETPEIGQWRQDSLPREPELLIPFGDPSNLGAICRSAVAFGIKKLVLLEESANPFHYRAIRSSVGSVFQLEFVKGPSIQALASTPGLICLDARGETIANFKWPEAFRLLIGDEGPGIPDGLRDGAPCLRIPASGNVESLNAMVAGSIAMSWFYCHGK